MAGFDSVADMPETARQAAAADMAVEGQELEWGRIVA